MAKETWKERFERWTRVATAARAFVLALVALIAALVALGTGVAYLTKVVNQIRQTHEQSKEGVAILASDLDKVSKASQQNHEDIVSLHEYILGMKEDEINAILSSTPVDAGVSPPMHVGAGARYNPPSVSVSSIAPTAHSAPVIVTYPDPTESKRRRPPTVGPKPEFVEPLKANEVFR